MAEVHIQCCDICKRPIESVDARDYGWGGPKTSYARKEGLVIELGFSRGGWSRREDWLNFSGEVCGECFDAAEAMLGPIIEFIRNRGERSGDQAPVRKGELPSKGRGKSLRGVLRALPGR